MTAVSVRGTAGTVGPSSRMAANEAAKILHLMWWRKGMLVTGVAVSAVVYLQLRVFIGGGHIATSLVAVTLPGLTAYFFAAAMALQGSGSIAEEIHGGTLEHTRLSPGPQWLLALGRLGGLATEGVIGSAVLAAGFGLGFAVRYSFRPALLVPILLTALDALGYVLLIMGLTAAVAGTGAITHVFNTVILFFNGTLVPVMVFPHGIELMARLVPTTLGVELLSGTLAGRPLAAGWSNGTLPWLLLHTVVMSCLGWATYLVSVRRAGSGGS